MDVNTQHAAIKTKNKQTQPKSKHHCITIIKDENNVSIRAGGGIVADSIPKRELEEARAKAKGMINALI